MSKPMGQISSELKLILQLLHNNEWSNGSLMEAAALSVEFALTGSKSRLLLHYDSSRFWCWNDLKVNVSFYFADLSKNILSYLHFGGKLLQIWRIL